MNPSRVASRSQGAGFSLIEISIVLLIISLLLGTFLVPFGGAFEESQRKTVKAQLEEINDALIGFAASKVRLPCPASGGSGGSEDVVDTATGECRENHGFVPSTTLGLVGVVNVDGLLLDVWGNPLRYSVTDANSSEAGVGDANVFDFTGAAEMQNVGMSDLNPDLVLCLSASNNTGCESADEIRANSIPAVVFSMGKDWREYDSADQLANAGESVSGLGEFGSVLVGGVSGRSYPVPGDKIFVSKSFNQIEGDAKFDDIVSWLPENVLYTRLIQAGVLP